MFPRSLPRREHRQRYLRQMVSTNSASSPPMRRPSMAAPRVPSSLSIPSPAPTLITAIYTSSSGMRRWTPTSTSTRTPSTLRPAAVTPRNRDRFFQEGGSFGGPVRIPHLYNGRDKTFFFVNYDRTIQPNSTLVTQTVPTAAQRTGDLSNALAPIDAYGNSAHRIFTSPAAQTRRNLQTIKYWPIDPAAAKILALLPLPNTVGTYDAVTIATRATGLRCRI